MLQHILSFLNRFKALADKSAIFLIVPFLLVLYFIDAPMAKTLIQWLVFAPILAGAAIIVSRVTFPQVNLSKLVEEATIGNKAAGFVAGALIIFVGLLVLALVSWAKA